MSGDPAIHISVKKLFFASFGVVFVLVAAYVCTQYLVFSDASSVDETRSFVRWFNLDSEVSIPTWFSQILLFIASCAAAVVAAALFRRRKRGVYFWIFLAVVFAYLSLDEGASLHEPSTAIVQAQLAKMDVALERMQIWLVGGAALLILFALFCARPILAMPGKVQLLFFGGLVVYGLGAVGTEALTATVLSPDAYLHAGFGYTPWVALEEGLEMTGAILFGCAALVYLRSLDSRVVFVFNEPTPVKSPERSVKRKSVDK